MYRKHERRHIRPFGCTFDNCNKAFGSKNDWKRHESSQHFQEETWRCNQPHQPEGQSQTVSQSDLETITPCAEVFYQRNYLMQHLQEKHCIFKSEELNQICDSQRIGRHLLGTFWCGFCQEVIIEKHSGRAGWDERCDHIGRHFHPEGLKISDWLPSSGTKTKSQIQISREEEHANSPDEDEDMAEDGDNEEVVESPSMDFPPTVLTGSDALGISTQSTAKFNSVLDPNAVQIFASPTEETQSNSPIKKGSNSRQQRHETPFSDLIFCCACNEGPFSDSLRNCTCFRCGHCCEECFSRPAKRAKIEVSTL